MQTVWQDVKYGVRLLLLNPGFAIVAILSLALGIGANTAIFQLIDAVRIRTLPVKNPQDLAMVRVIDRHWGLGRFNGPYSQLTNPLWEEIRARQQAFSSIFAWRREDLNLATGGEVRNATVVWVSGDFFKTLEVEPLMGRVLTPADDQRGCGSPNAVISYAFWQREFGGAPDILGRKLTLESHPFEIVGVTPAGFYGVEVGRSLDAAIPICYEPVIHGEYTMLDVRHAWWLAAIGRLKPGWTLAQATAQLTAVSPAMLEATLPPVYDAEASKHYFEYKFGAFPADTGFSNLRNAYASPLWLLLSIAGLVLLIACANLANLMLARASAREREIGIRLSLGASRGRLIRQLFSESLLLAAVGAALGAALAQGLSRFLAAYLSTQGNRLFVDLGLDWRVLGFTAGLAVLTTVLFGLTPALQAARVAPVEILKSNGRSMTTGRERFSLRRGLVVSQVAISLVLLVGALLFVRSLRNLLILDTGFRQDGILITDLDLSRLKLPAERRQIYKRELLDHVRAIPGVLSAADTTIVPVSGYGWKESVLIDGTQKSNVTPSFSRISPGYFKTLGTPLLAGRDFDDRDTATSPKVAIVNQSFARKLVDGANPIGRTFRIKEYVGRPTPMYEIVGLVKDTKYYDLREELEPIAFVAAAQDDRPDQSAQFLIRSDRPLPGLLSDVKHTIAEASAEINLTFHVFKSDIQESLLRERLMATLSGFFGFLAGLLATIGLYGLISYNVARRTNEIGIRMALGAQRGDVVRMILREAGILLGIGLAAGTALSLLAAKTASSLLFGLKPRNPVTLAAAIAALAAVTLAASFLPARRASRLDPMVALRDE
ncbi:MAG TPA: ABC transporter permease [Candidatus Acidoferrales bacterium]|nr:ABC transporter permease [Candidatus Acidoferrales bacterium]